MTQIIRIEQGVPIPEKQTRTSVPSPYPFGMLQVGDSFTFPIADRAKVSSHSFVFRRDNRDVRFSFRKVSPTEVRVWRVE